MNTKKLSRLLNLLFIIGFPTLLLILLILPSNFFDKGESICLSKQLFNQTCYGCGMTKSIQHLIHLEWLKSIEYNKLSSFVLLILSSMWIYKLYSILNLKRPI